MEFDSGNDNVNDMIIASQNHAKNDTEYLKWIDISNLRIRNKLDEGNFGAVYKADWEESYHYSVVAIKFFYDKKEFLKEFTNIYRMIRDCSEEDSKLTNIVCYIGATYDDNDDDYGIVMKYYPQSSLYNYLYKDWRNIYWSERLKILRDISYGLYTLHFRNFIHGDLHSGNVMIDRESLSFASIGDLGFCRVEETKKKNNHIIGIIPFIAPEVLAGSPHTKKADIYSFGMIMYQVSTNRPPFYDRAHDNRLMKQIRNGERPELYLDDDMPLCFESLMRHCWNADSRSRPNALTLYDKFNNWIGGDQFEDVMWNRIDEPIDKSQYHKRATYTTQIWYVQNFI